MLAPALPGGVRGVEFFDTGALWHRLLRAPGVAVSESGRLRQGAGGHPGGDRCRRVRRVLMLAALSTGPSWGDTPSCLFGNAISGGDSQC